MKKRVLSATLAIAMLASSVGAMNVFADDSDKYTAYTPKAAINVGDVNLDLSKIYTGSYEDAMADGISGDYYYLFDYEEASQKGEDVVTYDKLVDLIEDAVDAGDYTGNNSVDGETGDSTKWTAAVLALTKYYADADSNNLLDFDDEDRVNYMSADREAIVDLFDAQLANAESFLEDIDFYDTEDVEYYNAKALAEAITAEGVKDLSAANSVMAYLAAEGERIFPELGMTTNWEDKYTELYDEVTSWPESDFTSTNYRKITRLIEDAEDELNDTEKGYKKAYDILMGAYDIETVKPDYAALEDAVEGLFKNGKPEAGIYDGSNEKKHNYLKSDYTVRGDTPDEWYDFAGYGKEGDEDYIEGAYRKAYDVYERCQRSSTRKTVRQSEVDEALEELDAALLALDPNYETSNWVVVMLEDALEVANNVVEDDYRTTSSYWKNFREDVEYIEKLLEQDVIKQSTAEKAIEDLFGDDMDATKGKDGTYGALYKCALSVPSSTKKDLRDAIKEAKNLLEDEKAGKTSSQITNLEKAIEDAEDVDDLISAYEEAIANLETAVNAFNQKQGWYTENGTWYYGKEDTVAKGWLNVNGVWYLLDDTTGAMKTGWQQVNGTWYYLNASGAMQTGWLNLNGTYYYLESWGGMATGWKNVNGSWYYLQSSGAMVANGWYWINGKCYYFYNWGGMAANTTINGWTVGADGAWIQ